MRYRNGLRLMGVAANAALNRLVCDGLVDTVAQKGAYLKAQLHAKLGQHPHIGDITGRGLFIGIELVESREDKRPFDSALNIARNLKKTPFNQDWPVILRKARLTEKR